MKSLGEKLKSSRESQGYTIVEISLATKINARILKAIEDGDADHLPPKTFLRGFIRTYAQYLKLDVEEILSAFYQEMGSTRPSPLVRDYEAAASGAPSSEDTSPAAESPAAEPLSSSTPGQSEARKSLSANRPSKTRQIAVVALVTGLCVLITFVWSMINKYEKERAITQDVSMTADSTDELATEKPPQPILHDETSKNPPQAEVSGAPVQGLAASSPPSAAPTLAGPTPSVPAPTAPSPVAPTTTASLGSAKPEKVSPLPLPLPFPLAKTPSPAPSSLGPPPVRAPAKNSQAPTSGTLTPGTVSQGTASQRSTSQVTTPQGKAPSATPPTPPTTALKAKSPSDSASGGSTVATNKPAPAAPSAPKPSETPKAEAPKDAKVEPKKPSKVQEVLIEALDHIDISYQLDDGKMVTTHLKPEQVKRFRALNKINLKVSDGGALNVIYNGHDRGAAGELGKPAQVHFP